jgi:hypothetical protein
LSEQWFVAMKTLARARRRRDSHESRRIPSCALWTHQFGMAR